jgi:hypothetical protein
MSLLATALILIGGLTLLVVAGLAIWFWLHVRPIRFLSHEDLHRHFVLLTRAPRPNAELRIRVRGGPTTLRFILRPQAGGSAPTIMLEFPRQDWSDSFYPMVKELATEAGLEMQESHLEEGPISEVLKVGFGSDTRGAANFAWEVIRTVYGVERPEAESNVYPIIPGTFD